jgi:uncharacterized membrane protein
MGSSPEEKVEVKKQGGATSTGLKPNVAGLLCYVGIWVTGIIFLIIETKNKTVRFHAMQSLVVFGILQILTAIGNGIRAGAYFSSPGRYVAGSVIFWIFEIIIIVLWIVLMYKAYRGQLYKVPWAGNFAEKMLAKLDQGKK